VQYRLYTPADFPALYAVEELCFQPPWCFIGVELLGRAEGSARAAGASAIGLHVRVDNETAIRLYEGHGYTCRGREEYYYAREPALFYAKPLSESPKARQN
jgi:GNAT superfamily N-acetyltransferase